VSASGDESVEEILDAKLEGRIIYLANPVRQFSAFTNKSENLHEQSGIYMSESSLKTNGFNEGDTVLIKTVNGELRANIISDNKIEGDIATLPTFDTNLNSQALFSGYRFSSATIQGV
jgi:NADH-quinone oxidoreductase subunit G